MKRRDFLGTVALGTAAAAGVAAAPLAAQQPAPAVKRRNRIKQGLWRTTFGEGNKMSLEEQCQHAARLGAHGFDLIPFNDWPTLRKHGLKPLLAPAGPVTFENGLINPAVHADLEPKLRAHIDQCAANGCPVFISIGGQRRGMPYEQAADNAVAFLNRIKSHLEDKQVTIAIENMNNRRMDQRFGRPDQVFGRWAWGVGVCERVNSPNVKLVCDLYHLQIMDGDIATNVRDHSKWIAHFHTAGVPSRNEIDDTQEMNYGYIARVIAELKDFTGYVSHEWRPTPGKDPIKSIEQAMDLMDV